MTSQFIIPPPADQPGGALTEAGVLSNNPHIKYVNFRDRGYAVVECAAPNELNVIFRAARARSTARARADVFDLARFRVARRHRRPSQQL